MQQSDLHTAKTFSSPVKVALEQLLGRSLADNESISIRAYQPHEGPQTEQQLAIAAELRRYFERVDAKAPDISEAEAEEVISEAIRSVRPLPMELK